MSSLPSGPLRRLAVLVAVALVVLLGPARPAGAHAELLATNPTDGAVVSTAPKALTMQFSEGVSLRPDGVRVLDSGRGRVDTSSASSDDGDVTVPLKADLAQGTYVVVWRVVSADGHPVRGSFTFSVGKESAVGADVANRAFASGNDRRYEQVAAVLRALAYLGALGAAGFVLVGAALRRDDEPSPVNRATVIAAGVALVAMVLQVPLQGALATGRGLGAVAEPSVLGLALADGMGFAALLTAVSLLAIMITGGLPFEGPTRRVAQLGAVLAPVGFALTGHTRTMSPAVVAYAADVAHLAAGAVWFGGLLAVAAVVRRRRHDDDPVGAAEAIASFSGWAFASAAVVVVAGTVLAWIEVGGLHALTTTTYGRLLLAKVAAVALVLAAAGWNRFRLVPRVAAAAVEDPPADHPAGWSTLVRLVRAEAVLIVAVLCLTGVLANVTPAKAAAAQTRVSVTVPLGSGTLEVDVDPARAGRNDIHLYVFDAKGRPDGRFKTAAVQLELPSEDLGPFDRVPAPSGPGHFLLVATPLSFAGQWKLTFTVKPDTFTEQKATATFRVR